MDNSDEYIRLREAEAKREIEVRKAAALASIEAEKKASVADIELHKTESKLKSQADIQAEKELQKTALSCLADGSVILQKEGFLGKISGQLPIKIKAARCYCHIEDVQPAVLVVVMEKSNGEEVSLFWDMDRTEDTHIRKIFEKQGVFFGFGAKKESDIRRMILQMARNFARACVLPEAHGWYLIGNDWKYAFPEEITWEEVRKLC